MKKIIHLLTFLLLSNLLYSQCDSLLAIKHDKFNNKDFYASKEKILIEAKGSTPAYGITLNKAIGSPEIQLIFVLGGLHCFRGDDKVSFLFTDGSKYDFLNRAGRNCEGTVMVNMGGALAMKKQLKALSEHKIDMVRIYGISGFTDLDLSEEVGNLVNQSIICLSLSK